MKRTRGLKPAKFPEGHLCPDCGGTGMQGDIKTGERGYVTEFIDYQCPIFKGLGSVTNAGPAGTTHEAAH